jgi:hypothetical protein
MRDLLDISDNRSNAEANNEHQQHHRATILDADNRTDVVVSRVVS